jgi:hypothetical protein
MKRITPLILGLAAVTLATTSFAQPTPPPAFAPPPVRETQGLLGQNYADFHFGVADFRHSSGDAFRVGVSGMTPVAPGLDFGFVYAYQWEDHSTDVLPRIDQRNPAGRQDYDGRAHSLAARTRVYASAAGLRPFLEGVVGHQWGSGDLRELRMFDNRWIWGGRVGLEIPLGVFALTPHLGYTDKLGRTRHGLLRYGGELHHWFNDRTGGYFDVSYHEPRGSGGLEFWTYTAGIRVRY